MKLRRTILVSAALAAGAVLGLSNGAFADVTDPAGGGQPQNTIQPSTALNYLVQISGAFHNLGEIHISTSNVLPIGFLPAEGQLLAINTNQALFSVYGTSYGGNGVTNFALPDLRGRTPIGVGDGPGLTPQALGQTSGVESVSLNTANLPAHDHTMPAGGVTGITGGNQPYTNVQPTVAINYRVPMEGIFPAHGPGIAGTTSEQILGFVYMTGSAFVPPTDTVLFAKGQVLDIVDNAAQFSLLGTSFGGDGIDTYALPDLQGRAPIGAGQGPGLSAQLLGQQSGVENVALNIAQLPAHDHGLPPSPDNTGATGANQSQTNMQPTLALNFLIATSGYVPGTVGVGADESAFLGEIALFAGDFAPRGWLFAAGQLLSIIENQDLFSLIGTIYGGDGLNNFALPDLRDMLVIGAGQGPGLTDWDLGERFGDEDNILSENQMPTHVHTHEYNTAATAAPEPVALSLFGFGLLVLSLSKGGLARRRRTA